jgi:hypothetical protein
LVASDNNTTPQLARDDWPKIHHDYTLYSRTISYARGDTLIAPLAFTDTLDCRHVSLSLQRNFSLLSTFRQLSSLQSHQPPQYFTHYVNVLLQEILLGLYDRIDYD